MAVLAMLAVSCTKEKTETFTVSGQILEAAGKTLYFDNLGLTGAATVDSVKLDDEGNFSFSKARPELFEFYRLRIGSQTVNLAVDSTENITVNASLPSMSVAYQVEGSEDSKKLKDLVMKQITLQQNIRRAVEHSGPETGILQRNVNEMVDVFKSEVRNEFIYPDPEKSYAYYALFMSINGTPVFNPQADRLDAKTFASVATVLDLRHPGTLRTENLHNIALKGMKATTTATAPMNDEDYQYLLDVTSESGIIDITLPDYKGNTRKLSELAGKVVLLDFTAYKTDYSAEYNLALRELHNKYASRGFEIYQVSFDADEHFWITGAQNLPWVCVHDENSLASAYIGSYQVAQLPTAFLISKESEIVKRMQSYDELDADIEALLAK